MKRTAYRANIERLNEVFPEKEALNASEIARFLGIDRKTVTNDNRFKKNFTKIGHSKYMSKATLISSRALMQKLQI